MQTNHKEALWQAVRSRNQAGQATTRAFILDDLKQQGLRVKDFSVWLNKLIKDGSLHLEGDTILMGGESPVESPE